MRARVLFADRSMTQTKPSAADRCAAGLAEHQACMFMVANHCFAIDSALVAEVLNSAALTPVPLAPEAIVGLLHLRGRIVPVIDMRRRLGFDLAAADAPRNHLVLRLEDGWCSLLVDEVLDVQSFASDRLEHPTQPATEAATDAVTGIFADEERLVHFLDPQRIVQSLVRNRAAPLIRHGASHGG